MANYRRAAKFYAETYGWAVVPIVPTSKRPFVKWKHLTREESHARIDKWWAEWPGALVGVLTGERSNGLVVIDIDARDDAALTESDRDLILALPRVTKRAETPGGTHVYTVTDQRVPNRNRITPNIDVRGEGGLVVAPPAKGRVWDGDFSVAGLPREALRLLRARSSKRRPTRGVESRPGVLPGFADASLSAAANAVANAPEGERNETLNREVFYLAGYVAVGELDPETIREEMLAAAEAAGLEAAESERTVESALDTIRKEAA